MPLDPDVPMATSTSGAAQARGRGIGAVVVDVVVAEGVLMEGGRLDWGECNRESDGSDAVEPEALEPARSGEGGARRRG